MFPILTVMYVRLAYREERETRQQFGEAYTRYAVNTPAFFPRPAWFRRGAPSTAAGGRQPHIVDRAMMNPASAPNALQSRLVHGCQRLKAKPIKMATLIKTSVQRP
jgi:hypothetical protein